MSRVPLKTQTPTIPHTLHPPRLRTSREAGRNFIPRPLSGASGLIWCACAYFTAPISTKGWKISSACWVW
ncbi:hypothetical protein FIBSPDRAFT_874854 [Athelia psychrophila]|uniref:Uncharacterized protein n=1 Tax=Athelia psychrophila TaxID=1759441 RepID=A0A165X1D4_9AGAM|nr:hypothetical protein FIBSPDRAFT_874854 [Fibularhizoctonia sp. CBS 109695]